MNWWSFQKPLSPTIRLVLAILALQLVYWGIVQPIAQYHALEPQWRITQFEVAPQVAADDQTPLQWQSVTAPWTGCCEQSRYVIRHIFHLSEPPEHNLGLLPVVAADNFHVYINGVPVRAEGDLHPYPTFHGMQRSLTRVPKELLHQGDNEIRILTVRSGVMYTDLYPAYLGAYDSMYSATRWGLFMMMEYRLVFAGVSGVVAIVALVLLARTRNRAFAGWLLALAVFWCLRNSYYFWFDFPLSGTTRLAYYFVISNGLFVAWLGFAHAWTGVASRGWQNIVWLAVALTVGVTGVAVAAVYQDIESGFDFASSTTNVLSLALMALTAGRIGQHVITRSDPRYWEVAAFLLCLTAIVTDVANEIFWQQNSGHISRAAPIFLAALVIAMAGRNVHLYESVQAFNDDLNQRLAEREREISANYAALAQAQQREVLLQERQRRLRDMHDGIGGQLVTLVAGMRRAGGNGQTVAALEATIDDLRLLIDSLDDVSSNLATGLGIFRSRIEPRLLQAGYALEFNNRHVPLDIELPPKTVLNIYRILQEAITNAIKHATPGEIQVTARIDAGVCEITVLDRGGNQSCELPIQGRGAQSMRRRAAEIRGRLFLSQSVVGTSVCLTFPIDCSAVTRDRPSTEVVVNRVAAYEN